MLLMASSGFGVPQVAKHFADSATWTFLGREFDHAAWTGCTLWDLIQPAFMFMVGVALPWSMANRTARGQNFGVMFGHALWRALLLVLLAVFLTSAWSKRTEWVFTNVLAQTGLGYAFLFLIAFTKPRAQWVVAFALLFACWLAFALHPLPPASFDWKAVGVPEDWPRLAGFAAHWEKNANFAAMFDLWFLNLFPREAPFTHSAGGDQTLNFVPSLATMIFGLIAGRLLRGELTITGKLNRLLLAGVLELAAQPHAYSRPYREAMYGWKARHLQSQGRSEPLDEGDLHPLPEKDPRLLCDPQRQFISKAPTVVEFARQRAREMVARLPDANRPDTRASLLEWARALAAPREPHPHRLSARTHRKESAPGGSLEYISFNSEDGETIPGLLWLPTHPPPPVPIVLIVDERGKASVAESGLVASLLAAGQAVPAVDLRGRGETLGRYGPDYDINFRLVANQVLAGRPLAGRRAFDLQRAIDYLATRKELDVGSVTVVGLGGDALPALLAAAIDSRVRQVAVAGYVHSVPSQMRARTPPPLAKMGEAWNDPQPNGRVNCGDDDVDFGSVIPFFPRTRRRAGPRHPHRPAPTPVLPGARPKGAGCGGSRVSFSERGCVRR
jgi:hypothetical protein